MIKFWWRSGSPSGYWDCFPDSLLGDTENGITDCAARRCSARHALAGIAIATSTSLRLHPFAEVCTVPLLLVLVLEPPANNKTAWCTSSSTVTDKAVSGLISDRAFRFQKQLDVSRVTPAGLSWTVGPDCRLNR